MKHCQWLMGSLLTIFIVTTVDAEQYSSIGVEININDNLDVDENTGIDNLDSYGAYGLTFEQQFTQKWGGFFKLDIAEADLDNINGTADVMRFTAGIRRYAVDHRMVGWRPFVGAALGYTDVDYETINYDDSLPSVRLEAGLQRFFNSWVADIGLRASHEFADSQDTNGHAFVGIRYLFNKKQSSPNKSPVAIIPAAVNLLDSQDSIPVQLNCTQQDLLSVDHLEVCAEALQESMALSFNILFDTDQSSVNSSQMDSIERFASVLAQYPKVRLMLGGHTDSQGSLVFNQRLSERRSAAVKEILIKQFNIAPERIITTGFGELDPVADNSQSKGRQLNRRVDAVIGYGDLNKATEDIVSGDVNTLMD